MGACKMTAARLGQGGVFHKSRLVDLLKQQEGSWQGGGGMAQTTPLSAHAFPAAANRAFLALCPLCAAGPGGGHDRRWRERRSRSAASRHRHCHGHRNGSGQARLRHGAQLEGLEEGVGFVPAPLQWGSAHRWPSTPGQDARIGRPTTVALLFEAKGMVQQHVAKQSDWDALLWLSCVAIPSKRQLWDHRCSTAACWPHGSQPIYRTSAYVCRCWPTTTLPQSWRQLRRGAPFTPTRSSSSATWFLPTSVREDYLCWHV